MSFSSCLISESLEKQGDLSGALSNAGASLKIDEKLSALDPTNATWQKDVKASGAWVEQLSAQQKKR